MLAPLVFEFFHVTRSVNFFARLKFLLENAEFVLKVFQFSQPFVHAVYHSSQEDNGAEHETLQFGITLEG
ncbi:hypothetical protein MPTK1_2g15240 [Marchantia polymorpha subsp. ruderalis]|uniref:Uncharacterized protein n=1 Tax=Marchantia polymorpha TaxID=3197 RepID=A0A2R6WJX9_MARPO|nr:hypothetical protein MARPO_0082s0020 [Marchantia polymorpha]BBN02422.1 hypothetical protein Mp_2g15240 [Marchantia polymorpha subsp. ruderalis]|eukprot:PTQ34168.1 hypothetical protein MARPO_0082s0020 [Marchantia polymorpha]